MKFKNITLILLLVLISVTFCGCAAIGYVFQYNEDGSAVQYLTIILDEELLTEAGEYENVKQDILDDFTDYGAQLLQEYRMRYALVFGSFVEPDSNDLTYTAVWYENEFRGAIKYANSTVINLLYGGDDEPLVWVREESFFTITIFTQTSTIYEGLRDKSFYHVYQTKYADIWDEHNTLLVYQYVTSSSRLHSDANYIERENREAYVHTWVFSAEDMDRQITFYYTQANYPSWYILALISTASIGSIYTLVVLIVSKIRKIQDKKNIMQ